MWVNGAVLTVGRSLPVYPDKQTSSDPVGMPASENLHNSCRDAEWCCWIAAHRVFGYVAFNRAIFTSLG
jgi:hypothetical protein